MRIGLIARCDDRGLGVMTWEFYRHIQPDRTLVVLEPGSIARGFESHTDRYPDAYMTKFVDGLDERVMREFLYDLDVVYTAETFYNWQTVAWARELGVRTVLHAMPEFFDNDRADQPDAVWIPTCWRLEHLPKTARLVPVPVATDRWPDAEPRKRIETILHVAGNPAALDRAGTTSLLRALRYVSKPVRVRIITQGERVSPPRGLHRGVEVEIVKGGVEDYWRLYDDADVLVSPRRYGGLSLPWNEACGAGLGLVVPDTEPNHEWPAAFVPTQRNGTFRTGGGVLDVYETNMHALAAKIDELTDNPAEFHRLSLGAFAWARVRSWEMLRDHYVKEFEHVCE